MMGREECSLQKPCVPKGDCCGSVHSLGHSPIIYQADQRGALAAALPAQHQSRPD
jgi:hypothetical protein